MPIWLFCLAYQHIFFLFFAFQKSFHTSFLFNLPTLSFSFKLNSYIFLFLSSKTIKDDVKDLRVLPPLFISIFFMFPPSLFFLVSPQENYLVLPLLLGNLVAIPHIPFRALMEFRRGFSTATGVGSLFTIMWSPVIPTTKELLPCGT